MTYLYYQNYQKDQRFIMWSLSSIINFQSTECKSNRKLKSKGFRKWKDNFSSRKWSSRKKSRTQIGSTKTENNFCQNKLILLRRPMIIKDIILTKTPPISTLPCVLLMETSIILKKMGLTSLQVALTTTQASNINLRQVQ